MSKWGTQEAGVVIATELSVPEISLPATSPIPARGFRWTELSRFAGNCLVVVGFCFFLLFKFTYLDLFQLGGN